MEDVLLDANTTTGDRDMGRAMGRGRGGDMNMNISMSMGMERDLDLECIERSASGYSNGMDSDCDEEGEGEGEEAASDRTSTVGDDTDAPPHKRCKLSRELPAEAIAVFKSWMLSEKNFAHPVSCCY
jgi:hypothetical protein